MTSLWDLTLNWLIFYEIMDLIHLYVFPIQLVACVEFLWMINFSPVTGKHCWILRKFSCTSIFHSLQRLIEYRLTVSFISHTSVIKDSMCLSHWVEKSWKKSHRNKLTGNAPCSFMLLGTPKESCGCNESGKFKRYDFLSSNVSSPFFKLVVSVK